jgi:hypothetical protein
MARSSSLCALLLSFLMVSFLAAPARAEKRVALVIGNSAYRNVAQLDNPASDARLLADTLGALGFTLVGGGPQLDLDKASLDRVVQDFGARLQGADVGLLYYAGHGVQVRGTNYLVPVDANPTREADVDFQMLDVNLVVRQMEGAGTRLNIIMLDACRNNPFGSRALVVGRGRETESVRFRDTASGLAQMQAPAGTLISFATQPGTVAQDGIDGHSPYSRALVETLRKPGLGIFDTFNQVGLEVKRATGGSQQPWVSSSPIDGQFYFVAPQAEGGQQAALSPRQPQAPNGPIAPGAPTSDVRRFDGLWMVDFVCERTASGLPRLSGRFVGRASSGVFHGQRGEQGKPGWVTYDGMIEPNGFITININGLSGDTTTDPFHRPTATPISYKIIGALEGTSGTATRDNRNCDIKFANQSAAVSAAPLQSSAPGAGARPGASGIVGAKGSANGASRAIRR